MREFVIFPDLDTWNDFLKAIMATNRGDVAGSKFLVPPQDWHWGEHALKGGGPYAWTHLLKKDLARQIEDRYNCQPNGVALAITHVGSKRIEYIAWTNYPETFDANSLKGVELLAEHHRNASHGGNHGHGGGGGKAKAKAKAAPAQNGGIGAKVKAQVKDMVRHPFYYALVGPWLPVWWAMSKAEGALDKALDKASGAQKGSPKNVYF
jgi:hypothetical protein